jgi:alpha-ketoglutarate-dependent taurine dioxygenase
MRYAKSRPVSKTLSNIVEDDLRLHGWSLIPHAVESVEEFSTLFSRFTTKLTFDPARENVSEVAQSVDAGTAAVGLHIENGNTPLPPDTIAFYSKKSASHGSQTTVCDGAVVLEKLGAGLRRRFEKPYSMTRHLPATIWRRYISQALDLPEENINQAALSRFIKGIPGQSFRMRDDEGIDYTLQLQGIRSDNRAGRPAFANALLGPSFNYEAPVCRFYSGEVIEMEILEELAALCEHHTEEISWDDGMVVLIDNKRVMHGRREILVPLSERQLCIGMGFN